jgi:hydrogenase maturation protease
MSDDGVGVRVIQHLREHYRFPEAVELLDGGTLGLDLLPRLEGRSRLLLVDAIDMDKPPGTVLRIEGDDIPLVFSTKLSPHQMGLQDLLAVAELQGITFEVMVLWGIQPESIGLGMELSAKVASNFGGLVQGVLSELAGWGVEVSPSQ